MSGVPWQHTQTWHSDTWWHTMTHCLPTGRCAKHSLVAYSAPINQDAACCTDSPGVNSRHLKQKPLCQASFLVVVWGVEVAQWGLSAMVYLAYIWVLIWGGTWWALQGMCEVVLSRRYCLPPYLCGLSLTQTDDEPLRADVCDI